MANFLNHKKNRVIFAALTEISSETALADYFLYRKALTLAEALA